MSGGGEEDSLNPQSTIELLADWFTKSLLPPIAKYVSMSGAITEEQAIHRAQHLDLIYS
jgi:hypothetical protein